MQCSLKMPRGSADSPITHVASAIPISGVSKVCIPRADCGCDLTYRALEMPVETDEVLHQRIAAQLNARVTISLTLASTVSPKKPKTVCGFSA